LTFDSCENIKIRDVRLIESPSHVIVLDKSRFVEITGITLLNHEQSPNTDGIDVTDSRDVFISNCYMESGDDLICLKSQTRMVENVVATNCTLVSDDAAIKLGTGGHVGTRFCTFSNIIIRNTRYGIALFQMDGGIYENLLFQNIIIETGSRNKNRYPIFVDIDKRRADGKLGSINNVQFIGLQIITDGNCLIAGQPEAPLSNLTLKDVTMTLTGINDVSTFKKPRGNKTLSHFADMKDLSNRAAHFTIGYVNGLNMENVKIMYAKGVENGGRRKDFELIEAKK
jgi:polygalacturonase